MSQIKVNIPLFLVFAFMRQQLIYPKLCISYYYFFENKYLLSILILHFVYMHVYTKIN